jgi:carbamoyl-phosphate synthase large subunit
VRAAALRIGVTGASGDVGMGTLRALRAAAAAGELELVAFDRHPERVPPPFADELVALPPVRDADYVDRLAEALGDRRIDVLLPCIDAEIVVLSRARERLAATGTTVVLAPAELVEAADDKLATAAFLDAHGVAEAATWDASLPPPAPRFPLVAKPRRGHGSEGVRILHDAAALDSLRALRPQGYCLQEHVDGPELTVGFLYDRTGICRDALALRREVAGGRTIRAAVADEEPVRAFVERFGSAVAGVGAVNAQLRIDPERGPLVFDVNARLSGSTSMRAALGFNDPIRLARHFASGAPIPRATVRRGTVYRYLAEWIVPE